MFSGRAGGGKGMAGHAGHNAAVYYCPMHPTYTSDKPGSCPICNMKLVLRETASPETASTVKTMTVEEILAMKPGEICLLHKCRMGKCMMVMTEEFARLGKCPHCGEDLGVIVKDAAPKGYANIELGPDKQQLIGVRTEPASRRILNKEIRTTGKIAYDPELYQVQEEYLQAIEASRKASGSTLSALRRPAEELIEAARTKLRLLGLDDSLILDLEKAGKPDKSLLYAQPGLPVWVYTPIYESELAYVKPGTDIEVRISSAPDFVFHGTIRALDPVVDSVTRTVRARAVLENPEGRLKPEMFVDVVIRIPLGEVLAIPVESVFDTGAQKIVFVARGGSFEPREVTVGARGDDGYEIKSGVSEGENVVVSGNFLIDSESRLKAALEGLGQSGGHVHGS